MIRINSIIFVNLKILIFISSIIIIFNIITLIIKKNRFDNIISKINQNLKINSYINNLKKSKFKFLMKLNNIKLLIIVFLYSLIIIFSSLYLFKSILTTFLICIFFLYLLYDIKFIILSIKENQILKIFPLYLANLEGYLKVNNDIILALKYTLAPDELKEYINDFNYSIKKGVNVYQAFENLKNAIDVNKINEIITLFQHCYMNGGNYQNLLSKYIKLLNNYNQNKQIYKEKIMGTIITLYILIFINIYVLVKNVLSNNQIMLNTNVGKLIINFNIISYFLIYYFSSKLRREN